MGTILILIGAIAIIVLVVGFGFGIFRLERIRASDRNAASGYPPGYPLPPDSGELYPGSPVPNDPYADPQADPYGTDAPSDQPPDMVNLFDYFSEEEPPRPQQAVAAPPVTPPAAETEEEHVVYDKLCGFKTGRAYLSEAQQLLNHAKEDERAYALAYFDFDRFRFINSLKGASLGDYALSRISQELPNIFPETSVCTRVSGDHFAVLFPLVDEGILEDYTSQLRHLSDRIRDDIGAKSGLRITIGFAMTVTPEDFHVGVLMQKANLARHCLKVTRSESYSVFHESMTETYLYGELAMDDYSENQYDDSEYLLNFQPLYDMRKGRVTGCETMARWTIEENNNSSKENPLTPENSKLPTNNLKIFYQTCRWMGRWRKAGKEVLLGLVNLPVTDLFKSDIDAYAAKCVSAFQLEPRTVAVEVDIAAILVDQQRAASQLQKIKDIGVSVVIYGLDRNCTTLDFLNGFPVDYVKFHRSVAHDIQNSEERMDTVKQLLQSAAHMNIRTIFEGIDMQRQGDLLQQSGAHYVQGRYGGNACAPDDFIHLLQEALSDPRRATGNTTVILDDATLARGEYKVY